MHQIEEEELVRIERHSYWGGRASSLEDLEQRLLKDAGVEFSAKNDVLANFLRDMATAVGKLALDNRKKQKEFEKRFSGGL